MLTPYMSLELPTPTVTLGPEWANELNAAFDLVDAHDHTDGKGVPVPSAGLNINADLGFNSWNATSLRSTRFSSNGSALAQPTDLRCTYVVDKDLYFNDGDGNQIRLTIGGAIDASSTGGISGMGATTASVSYSSVTSTFSFYQNTNLYALLAIGDLSIFDTSTNVNPKKVTIQTVDGLPASYSLTLPTALPNAQKFMTLDNSGNIAAPWVVDDNTIEIATNTIQLKDGGITNPKLADNCIALRNMSDDSVDTPELVAGAVTPGKMADSVFGQNGDTGTQNITSEADLTNCSTTISVLGREGGSAQVLIMLTAYGGTDATLSVPTGATLLIRLYVDGSLAQLFSMKAPIVTAGGGTINATAFPPSLVHIRTLAAGSHTIKFTGQSVGGTSQVIECGIQAIEIA